MRSNRREEPESAQGCVAKPDLSTCMDCGDDTHGPNKGHLRVVVKDRNDKFCIEAPGEVFTWNQEGSKQWSSIEWKRPGYMFVKWENKCTRCQYDPLRQSDESRASLRSNMSESGITPVATEKAYKVVRQMMAPDLLGDCRANDEQKKYAAKIVLWHWPQASREPMPENVRLICERLVCD